MPRVWRAVAFLTPLVVLIGCATQPQQYTFENTRTYDQSFDETWDRLMHYTSEHHLRITDEDKTKGEVRAVLTSDASAFFSCGFLPSFMEPGVDGTIQVILTAEGSRTRVTVWAWFSKVVAGASFMCTSTGVLEGEVLNAL